MGRWPWSGRYMVEQCDVLSISEQRIKKALKNFHPDSCFVVTVIRNGVEIFKQDIYVTRTPANFGGWRYWFWCRSCYRKVAKLYLPPNGRRYACRKCHNLTYRSQKQHDKNVTALLKSPAMMDLVSKGVEAGNFKSASLIMRAYFKLINKR